MERPSEGDSIHYGATGMRLPPCNRTVDHRVGGPPLLDTLGTVNASKTRAWFQASAVAPCLFLSA